MKLDEIAQGQADAGLFRFAVKLDATIFIRAGSHEEASRKASELEGALVHLKSSPSLTVFAGDIASDDRPPVSVSPVTFMRRHDAEAELVALGSAPLD